ncbi:unnamed protein product [Closterium sp. NIES-54]
MITSLAKHEVATGLDIKPSTGTNLLCVSCIGGKLARHTFPKKNSHAEEALAVLHIDLCGPFWVAIKVVSLYFLLLKDCHTRFVWVKPGAKKSDVLREFEKWLPLVERHTKKSVLMLCSNRGGEFLGKEFTAFVDEKGIVHDLTSPCTPRQNGMAEREMRTVVEAVDSTAGDDAVPIADQEEARPYVGEGVGLHGAVHDLRAPTRWEVGAQGSLGHSPGSVAGEQGLRSARSDGQQGGHGDRGHLLRDAIAGGVEGEVWASIGPDAGTPADRHLGGAVRAARRGRRTC